jgi:hypothetical protein
MVFRGLPRACWEFFYFQREDKSKKKKAKSWGLTGRTTAVTVFFIYRLNSFPRMAESAERAAVQLAELSNKYSEAQRNAQKAMSLFKDTREENEVLKSNFEALKQASLRPR